ncbi:polyadenylate-binding protein 4-like isoform X2 [Phalaenopsis equestris]|uniref:polyadenylate-binding protein 4-like isoform X2 n=1 Tax=Phalaenopsis equestris TaxID=78828 RepID=UPI0009E418A0|nr:polyadenylate-binding protein 4-like isoform X2 [Phalaenopsis equestris]
MGEAAPAVMPETPLPMPAVASPEKISLYVGDLDAGVSEEDLVGTFACFGTILSTRVCRDRSSGESLRYGYINFTSKSCAEKAFQAMNHVVLKGKPMRIMWTDRNPIGRKNGVGNLFVKNLDESIGGVELEKLFRPFGQVVSCKLQLDENGRNKGFGFVQMNNEEAALSAMTALHGTVPVGACKKLYVAKFVRKFERKETSQRPRGGSNLYIKNLEKDFSSDILREIFSEFGIVNSAVVMKDENGKSKGFGFVSFESPENAKKAMDIMNGAKLGSKILYVGPAQKKVERENMRKKLLNNADSQQLNKIQGTTVYVKNLDDSISDEALQERFASCGKILWSKACRYGNGRCRGYGFVCFSSFEEASKAVVTLNGSKLNGKHLYVAIAQQRETCFNSSQCQRSSTFNCPFISHPPYYIELTHDVASVYQPCRIGLPMENRAFQHLTAAPLVYSPNEHVRPYLRPTDMIAPLRPTCHAPVNSPMNPIMVCLPQETFYMPEGYEDDYYLNQRYLHPSRYGKGIKKTQKVQLQQPSGNGVKRAFSNTVPRDQQALLSKLDKLDPQLRKSTILEFLYCNVPKLEPKHASAIANMLLEMSSTRIQEILSKPKVLAQLVKETTAKGQRVEDQVPASKAPQLTEI